MPMEEQWLYFIMALGAGVVYWLTCTGKPSLKLKRIIIVDNFEDCRDVTLTLIKKCAEFPALGFDCEWLSWGRRRPVALLQLASVDGTCALVRLNMMEHMPFELKGLLEDPSILKVGVAPSEDAKYLMIDYGIVVHGCLDLRHLMQRLGGNPLGGFSGLTERVLGVKMDKSLEIRTSNWESPWLSERQILYAANDAWFAVKILQVFALGRLKLTDCSVWDQLELYLKSSFHRIPSYVWEYVDCSYKPPNNAIF